MLKCSLPALRPYLYAIKYILTAPGEVSDTTADSDFIPKGCTCTHICLVIEHSFLYISKLSTCTIIEKNPIIITGHYDEHNLNNMYIRIIIAATGY